MTSIMKPRPIVLPDILPDMLPDLSLKDPSKTPPRTPISARSVRSMVNMNLGDDHRLGEDILTQTLEQMAHVETYANGRVDSVTIQSAGKHSPISQDRRIAGQWDLADGEWVYAGVFDGHGGEELAQYASEYIPSALKNSLRDIVRKGREPEKNIVSSTIQQTLSDFDDFVKSQFLDLFPGGVKQVSKMSDEQIQLLVNDHSSGGSNHAKTIRCMRGTTALIAVLSPNKKRLWIANIGDSLAVMAAEGETGDIRARMMTKSHNLLNKDEVKRLQKEHPGESNLFKDSRVIGAITVTRALGDLAFKVNEIYTRRVFRNTFPGFRIFTKVEDWNKRILSPPYLSNVADVHHYTVTSSDRYLILATGGLVGISYPEALDRASQDWVDAIYGIEAWSRSKARSLRILRRAVGGRGRAEYPKFGIDLNDLDDTTIIVMNLQ